LPDTTEARNSENDFVYLRYNTEDGMPDRKDHIWGIILAAGDGKRLKQYIRTRFNSDCPKQFCAFTGTRSMLSHTVARAELLIPSGHIVVTVNSKHRQYAQRDIDKLEQRNVIEQPSNRETSASILLPLLHIVRRDPDACVVIFPSDHFIREEKRFMDNVAAATEFVDHHPKYLLLLGIETEEFYADYGWIETSMKIAEIQGCEVFRVKRFLEKPNSQKIKTIERNRSLLNTMVFVGKASTVLRKFRLLTPSVYHAFKKIDTNLLSPYEASTVKEVYATLPSVDFSATILEHDAHGLAVLGVKDVYWSDWGNPERIRSDLARMKSGKGT
jgi:mannose-1-phosphate guanylyltransferase